MSDPGFGLARPVRRLRRLFATLMLLQYAAATWVIPAAHALFVDTRPEGTVHVETEGNRSCPPAHDHPACTVFSQARLLAAAPSVTRIPGSDLAVHARRPVEPMERPLVASVSSLGSRAPPLV